MFLTYFCEVVQGYLSTGSFLAPQCAFPHNLLQQPDKKLFVSRGKGVHARTLAADYYTLQ
ncbi:MAG: hypothetical protein ACTJLK_04390 [Anaplasma sp.]